MKLWYLHILHIVNDGYLASIIILLPFISASLGLTLTEVGILGTTFNSLGILLSLPAGYFALKFGGFKTLVLAAFLYGLAFIGIGFSQTYLWLFPMFAIAGIGFALFHPIGFALIARYSKKEERGTKIANFTALGEVGRMGFATSLTFIVVFIGWHNTAMLYGLIVVVMAAIFVIIMKRNKEQPAFEDGPKENVNLKTILTNKKFLFASVANFFDTFGSSSVFLFLPFLLLYRGANPALLGAFTAAFFVGTLAGKTAIGRLVDNHGSVKIFIICEIIMAILILIMANATLLPVILTCSVVLGIFTKGTIPVTKSMVSESVDHHGNFEKAFGVNTTFSGAALTIAPILLGFIADTYGIVSAFSLMAVIVILAIIPASLFHFTKQQKLKPLL